MQEGQANAGAEDQKVLRTEDVCGDGGIVKEVLREGTGEQPPDGSKVNVHYVGRLLDGTVFDSSRERGQEFDFRLGRGSVIKGWDKGVASMRVGELAYLICRSDYAYGKAGSPPKIPADATLKFEVELLGFDNEKEEWEMDAQEKLQAAGMRKSEGNELFKLGNIDGALSKYTKGEKYLASDYDFEDAQKEEAKKLKVSFYLNMAQCNLKKELFKAAIENADKAIKIDSNNVKALYRRGLGHMGMCDFEDAKKDLLAAQAIEDTADIRNSLRKVTMLEKESLKKEKNLYKGMFR